MNRFLPRVLLLLSVFLLLSCSEESSNAPVTYSVAGTVFQAGTGSPIADAAVIATGHDDGKEVGRTATGSDGAFLLKGLPAGALDIRVEAAGFAPVFYPALDPKEDAASLGEMSVQMSPADSCCSGSLLLRVKDGSGNPLVNKTVVIKKAGQIIDDPRTDANGKVLVADLCPGEYAIRIAVDGFRVYESVFVINPECDGVELTAVLQGEGEVCCDGVLTVNVKDENGLSVSGAQVRVWKSGAILQTGFTDTAGVAVFTDLCKGEYGVDVMKTGVTNREFGFAINGECDPVTKNVVVESLGCCSGVFTLVVRDANGNPVQGAKVQVRRGMTTLEAPLTNSNGQIVVDGLCRGEYNYRISKEGYGVVEGVFAIDENCTPVTREATLSGGEVCCSGVFTLVIRDGSGNPVQGVKVVIKKGGTVIEDPVTNGDGRIVVDGLCKGEYTYRATKEGYSVLEGSFAINASCEPVTKEVTMTGGGVCCSGVLTVTVTDSTNAPIEGATVKLWQGGAVKETLTTNAQGLAVFDGLCKGEYGVSVLKTGFQTREFTFAIGPDCAPYSKTVILEP